MFTVIAFTVKPSESADCRYRILQYRTLAQQEGVHIDHVSFMRPLYFQWQVRNQWYLLRLLLYPFLMLIRLWQVLLLAPKYDAVWVLRELSPLGPPILERLLFWRCKHVVLDIDDALHIPDKDGARFIPWLLRDYSKFGRMAHLYSAVVCGNEYLADFYRRYSARVHIIPTVVDPDRYAALTKVGSEIVRIGWIGTPLNKHHLDTLRTAFSELAHARQFELVIVGLNDKLDWDLPHIRYIKWNLQDEFDFFRHFDIGIMPLEDTPFSRGKCAFKLIQYMAAGLPVVASAVGANCDIVKPAQNGYLATTPQDWQTALLQLIDQPELRRRMGENGSALIRRSYSVRAGWASYLSILTAPIGAKSMLRALMLILLSYGMTIQLPAQVAQKKAQAGGQRRMQLGVDADNWSGQIQNENFEASLRRMKIDFISWHLQPEEEASPERLNQIFQFCRRNHWSYLFNTEVVNYRRDESQFRHQDGTFRYDLAEHTLAELKDDPLFMGVVYDEADLMQAMCGVVYGKGGAIEPYLADTRKLTPDEAFLSVAAKVGELARRYQSYGKRLIFEMVFPDYPFAFVRGGGLVAPKLLKENYNDLMYAVYRGAALEYQSRELWACVDLWFLDKFPTAGVFRQGDHTPEQLLETLQFASVSGFDFVYIEQAKALMNETYVLSPYGDKVIEFQSWHSSHQDGDWRTAPIEYYVKRFPDGFWGQNFSPFVPDHPYGSWLKNPYRGSDEVWLKLLHDLSHGQIPAGANNWNASGSPEFSTRPYHSLAGLPAMVVFDQFGILPLHTKAQVLDLSTNAR